VDCFAKSKEPPAVASSNATLEEHIKLFIKWVSQWSRSIQFCTCILQFFVRFLFTISTYFFHYNLKFQKTREAGRAWRVCDLEKKNNKTIYIIYQTLIAYATDKLRCGFEVEAKTCSRYKPRGLRSPPI
jgi:hypothetical protein